MAGKDQSIGALILIICLVGIVVYGYLLCISPYGFEVLQLTALIAVGGILMIGAWIGWTMATTPPPKPLEELEEEIEAKPEGEQAASESEG